MNLDHPEANHSCSICSIPERSYAPPEDIDYICGDCIQILLAMPVEKIEESIELAKEKGNTLKVRMLGIFVKG